MQRILVYLIVILSFTNSLNSQSTAAINVTTFTIEAPQLDAFKKIWVYLPKNYNANDSTYPVFYMHDAQNLFDDLTSYVGEWKVDEYLNTISKHEIIVIGIEHGNEKRIDELTPFQHLKYGGGQGDAYLLFIKNTLKPHIDITYRTKREAENTTIFGSSIGGLISFYAALKYPTTFGNAGVFSPSFWFSEDIYSFIEETEVSPKTRIFLLAGSNEGETTVQDIERVIQLLLVKGMEKNKIEKHIIEEGKHNEAFWSNYFPQAHQWILN